MWRWQFLNITAWKMLCMIWLQVTPVTGQTAWSISSSALSVAGNNDVGMRIYGQMAALFGDTTLRFCFYSSSTVTISNCQNALFAGSDVMEAGEWYDDGSGAVYFIGLGRTDRKIYVYQVTVVSGSTISYLLASSIAMSDYPLALSIDFRHRRMAVGGQNYLFTYDILDPRTPRLVDTSTSMDLALFPPALAGVSLHKNRLCTLLGPASGLGLICFAVSRGRLISSQAIDPDIYFVSVKIYDDILIAGSGNSNDLWIYNATTLAFLGKSGLSRSGANAADFFRSSQFIIANDFKSVWLNVFDISNAASPSLVGSSSVSSAPMSFTAEPGSLFSCLQGSSYVKHQITFPNNNMNWATFYANSEWNGYGRVHNTLTVQQSSSYTLINGVRTSTLLNQDVTDTYLPNDVTIQFIVNSVAVDFALQVLAGAVWTTLSSGQTFTQAQISANQVHVLDLSLNNPMSRNLSQVFRITANNTRGSLLSYTISVTRIYQSGLGCPSNAVCNGSTQFACVNGTQLSADGKQCALCPINTFKPNIGLNNCTQCPPNSVCPQGSSSFSCANGFVLNVTKATCDPISTPVMPPATRTSMQSIRTTASGSSSLSAIQATATTATSSSTTSSMSNNLPIFSADSSLGNNIPSAIISFKSTVVTAAPPPSSNLPNPPNPSNANATALPEITLIIIGAASIFFVALFVLAAYLFWRYRRRQRRAKSAKEFQSTISATQMTTMNGRPIPVIGVTAMSSPIATINSTAMSKNTAMSQQTASHLASHRTKQSANFSMISGITTHLNTTNPLALPGYLMLEYDVDFTLDTKLGEGGFSTVYRGIPVDSELQERAKFEPVAVKVMKESRDPKSIEECFQQEVAIMADLVKHDHFVKILGFTMTQKSIVMKMYTCGDFAQLIFGSNKAISIPNWTPASVIPLVLDLANALMFLHTKEISHNDIKPENVFIEKRPDRPRLVLGDFSFSVVRAKIKRGVKQFMFSTLDGMSVEFAAPEIFKTLRGAMTYDQFIACPLHARDVYAFGVMVWQVISRRTPWQGLNQNQIINEVLSGKRPDTQSILMTPSFKQWVPLMRIAQQCWLEDPAKRLYMSDTIQKIYDNYRN